MSTRPGLPFATTCAIAWSRSSPSTTSTYGRWAGSDAAASSAYGRSGSRSAVTPRPRRTSTCSSKVGRGGRWLRSRRRAGVLSSADPAQRAGAADVPGVRQAAAAPSCRRATCANPPDRALSGGLRAPRVRRRRPRGPRVRLTRRSAGSSGADRAAGRARRQRGAAMAARFEVLDLVPTPMGDISLWRRINPSGGDDIYEVKLGDEYLMSSVFTVAEVEVARLALAAAPDRAARRRRRRSRPRLHRADRARRPAGRVAGRGRRAGAGDRLARARARTGERVGGVRPALHACCTATSSRSPQPAGYDADDPERRYDAIVVDIDHSPRHLLHPSHAGFYTPDGVRVLASRLRRGRRVHAVVERPAGRRLPRGAADGVRRRARATSSSSPTRCRTARRPTRCTSRSRPARERVVRRARSDGP